MKIRIIKTCRTAKGEHRPGDAPDVSAADAEYLIANGYATGDTSKQSPSIESAEAPMAARESATIKTRKGK